MTPVEIRNAVFPKKAIGGVDESRVREFLERVSLDMEESMKDVRRMEGELDSVRQRMEENQSLETALKDALMSAQKTTGTLKKNAEKESLLLLREAELKAEKILDDARSELKGLNDEVRGLRNMKQKLRSEMKVLLQSYMDILSSEDR